MKIYRVEHPLTGDGPYRCWEYEIPGLSAAHTGSESHPLPGRELQYNEYCGFASMTDLLTWFKGWEGQLIAAGFHIAEYETLLGFWRRATDDPNQILFIKDYAELSRTHKIFSSFAVA